MSTKKCGKCGETKSLDDFYLNSSRSGRYSSYCKECDKAVKRASYMKNREAKLAAMKERRDRPEDKEKQRAFLYEKHYAITIAEYDAKLERQDNGCAICGKTPEENGRRLAIDHNHETGEIRGLLCGSCNSGIGLLQEDPDVIEGALLYLRSWTDGH